MYQGVDLQDTIVALATPQGVGAIGVIRLSGKEAISICNTVFKGKDLSKVDSHTIHFGTIRDEKEVIIDEVLASVFIAPNSFTKENVVEVSTHGSPYIINKIIQLFIQNGARAAKAGEFTLRAFSNGQFDLAQAEAVADLISSDSEASHKAAMSQMRGGFSEEIRQLREKLIHFASLIELELDFGEEDVEFADRDDLRQLLNELTSVIGKLIASFSVGNVIKEGIPTVIAGKPNAGKSTLLNALLNEEKAIVSDIPGTTRDFIEDEINIEGIKFRFIDTAGLRETEDKIEALGVQRTKDQMAKASMIVYLFDASIETTENLKTDLDVLEKLGIPFVVVANKLDMLEDRTKFDKVYENIHYISASQKQNLDELKTELLKVVNLEGFRKGDTVVTNARHYHGLLKTEESLTKVIEGLDLGITGDFLAMDIRHALYHLGELTGQITTDDLLDNIFSKFCIGK